MDINTKKYIVHTLRRMNNQIQRKQDSFLISAPVTPRSETQALGNRVILPLLQYSVICHPHLAKGKGWKNIRKGKGAAKCFLNSSGKSVESSSLWSWWLVAVAFHFVVFGTEGFGMELGEPGHTPQGVSVCSSYNPVAPKGIPELWLMQGIDCMDLGKSWLTTRPFSPLLPPLAPAPLFRGSVDVRMASLMDCCGIKQKPFSGGPGVLPQVLGSDWQGEWVNTGLKMSPHSPPRPTFFQMCNASLDFPRTRKTVLWLWTSLIPSLDLTCSWFSEVCWIGWSLRSFPVLIFCDF